MRMHEWSFNFHLQYHEAQIFEDLEYGPPSSVPAHPRNPLDNWLLLPPQQLFSTLGLTLKFERSQMVLEVYFGWIALCFFPSFCWTFPPNFVLWAHIFCFWRFQIGLLLLNWYPPPPTQAEESTLWPLFVMQVAHLWPGAPSVAGYDRHADLSGTRFRAGWIQLLLLLSQKLFPIQRICSRRRCFSPATAVAQAIPNMYDFLIVQTHNIAKRNSIDFLHRSLTYTKLQMAHIWPPSIFSITYHWQSYPNFFQRKLLQ
jgi:hypothetical protein